MKPDIQTENPAVPRERIIDTAIRLFFEQGYMATGTNQIIREAAGELGLFKG